MRVVATNVVRNEGTVVVFQGHTEDDVEVTFAVDHRVAADLAEALEEGEIACHVEPWQVLG